MYQSDADIWSGYLFNGAGGGKGLRIKGAFYNSSTPLLQVEANNSSGGADDEGNIRMIVQANGDVGIGTTLTNNPNGYLLAVNGTIGAKGIKVENTSTTWSDFVFNKNYKLMTLDEVKSYISRNKHLPDVPSASDIKKNGIDLANNQAILLRKIEELTLYTIKQKEQIDTLSHRLDKMQSRLANVESRCDSSNVSKSATDRGISGNLLIILMASAGLFAFIILIYALIPRFKKYSYAA